MLYMETLGERVKFRRENAELTLQALAAAIGKTKQAIQKIESGETKNPEAATIVAIAKKLNTTAQWIVTGRDSLTDELGQSHPRRPDFEKIVASITVLRTYIEMMKAPDALLEDRLTYEAAYAVVADLDQPVTASNVIDLAERLKDRLRLEENNGSGRAADRTGGNPRSTVKGNHRPRKSS